MNAAPDHFENAVRFAMNVLKQASDWQEAQTALSEHRVLGDWLRSFGDDDISVAQSIIHEAEERLGNALPY